MIDLESVYVCDLMTQMGMSHLKRGVVLQGLLLRVYTHFSYLPYMLQASSISFYLIEHWMCSIILEYFTGKVSSYRLTD
jgi:hypothetical protein